MAKEEEVEASDAIIEVVPTEKKGRLDKRKKIILAAAGALLLAGGGGGAYFWMHGSSAGAKEEASASEDAAEFVDVPPMIVNLRAADGAARFLKVHLMLVPGSAKGDAIKEKLPLIIDAFQPFLRELRPEDLAGSAAAFRLKEEMLVRANQAVGQGSVADVLIQDLIQQ